MLARGGRARRCSTACPPSRIAQTTQPEQSTLVTVPGAPKIGDPPEASNMRLVGYNDLQHRSAYQPTIHHQGDRYIAYIGHHGGTPEVPKPLNPLTGQPEFNGTSIVDVTDPAHPQYLAHIPGTGRHLRGGRRADDARVRRQDLAQGRSRARSICCASSAAKATRSTTSPIRPKPVRIWRREGPLNDTHKSFWECDTGIAYLVSGVPGWRVRRMTEVWDMSDPAHPVKIPRFRFAGPRARRHRAGADRTARHDFAGAAGEPRLFRLRHQQGRHHADRRPRQAAQRPEGADAGQSALSGSRPAGNDAVQWRAYRLPDAENADPGICQGYASAPCATSS